MSRHSEVEEHVYAAGVGGGDIMGRPVQHEVPPGLHDSDEEADMGSAFTEVDVQVGLPESVDDMWVEPPQAAGLSECQWAGEVQCAALLGMFEGALVWACRRQQGAGGQAGGCCSGLPPLGTVVMCLSACMQLSYLIQLFVVHYPCAYSYMSMCTGLLRRGGACSSGCHDAHWPHLQWLPAVVAGQGREGGAEPRLAHPGQQLPLQLCLLMWQGQAAAFPWPPSFHVHSPPSSSLPIILTLSLLVAFCPVHL